MFDKPSTSSNADEEEKVQETSQLNSIAIVINKSDLNQLIIRGFDKQVLDRNLYCDLNFVSSDKFLANLSEAEYHTFIQKIASDHCI